MSESIRKKLFSGSGLIVVICLILLSAVIGDFLFRNVQIDLTENNLYTISAATKELLADLNEDITVDLYFSASLAADIPQLSTYADHVKKLLQEFVNLSKGRLVLNIIDPIPFSEAEDKATATRLQSVPINNSGEKIYFGLVARFSSGLPQISSANTIPFFHQDKEKFLEYDLAQAIYHAGLTRNPVVGLVSGIGADLSFLGAGRNNQELFATKQLERYFDVRNISLGDREELDKIDLLILIHPQDLSDYETYLLEQFILRSGKAIIFVDPHSDVALGSRNQFSGPTNESPASDLKKLFAHWGLNYDAEKVVIDAQLSLPVDIARGNTTQRIRHLGVLGLLKDNLNKDDVITESLHRINLSSVGHLSLTDSSNLTLTPLLTSSATSMLTESSRFKLLTEPQTLAHGFIPENTIYTISARISGDISSSFDKAIEPPVEANYDDPDTESDTESDTVEAESQTKEKSNNKENLDASNSVSESAENTPLHIKNGKLDAVIIADTDLLSDNLWVQVTSFLGQPIASPFASNGDFLLNAVENFTGSSGLINIRSRAGFSRPFERIDKLRRAADENVVKQEQELQTKLRETETRLGELQKHKEGNANRILSPEQEATIAKFQGDIVQTRKDLRAVRRNLNEEIDTMGTILKVCNIIVAPLVLTFLIILCNLYIRKLKRTAK